MTKASTIATAPWKPEGWVSAKDLFTAFKLGCCLVASLLPARHWPAAARLLAAGHLRVRPSATKLLAGVSVFAGPDGAQLMRQAIAGDYQANIEAIRELLPGGWQGPIELVGREHLDRALQGSRGAVVWFSPFAGADLVSKKALAEAGYALTHLSAPTHPFSSTRFGTRVLNPVRLRATNRYTVRRVLVVYGNARPALDALKSVLLDNGVVSITATGAGARALAYPFLGGTLELAMGAPLLALQCGAALIPAFTLPDGRGGYRVELRPDLTPQAALPQRQALQAMASGFVDSLEPVVRAHPAQWEGWFHPGTWRPAPSAPAPAAE